MAPDCGDGTYNPVADTCTCPFSRTGAHCEQSLIPSCSVGDVDHTLRPLFWIQRITERITPGVQRRSGSTGAQGEKRSTKLGPLNCRCVREMLTVTAAFRSRWSQLPSSVLCATKEGANLASLLELGSGAFTWRIMSLAFDQLGTHAYTFDWEANETTAGAERAFRGRVLPLRDCVNSCDWLGWCTAEATRGPQPSSLWKSISGQRQGRCRCFPEAVPTRQGSCTRVQYAEPARGAAMTTARVHGGAARRHVAWDAIRIGELLVGRAANGIGARALYEPSTAAVSFNVMRCHLNCSGRGACDLHGLCVCDHGYWGLDCGVTRGRTSGRPIAWRTGGDEATTWPSPRVYVYDLPVRWRVGPQLLGEHDFALTERLLLSAHREADPTRADYFWLAGPNLQPRDKLEYVRAAWPYWNRSLVGNVDGPVARHILMLQSERGVGDTDLRPLLPTDRPRLRAREPPADGDMHPASGRRAWLALVLNGMEDFRSGARLTRSFLNASRRAERSPLCHVCFRPGVDIVVPPPAETIDVPSCDELKALTAAPPPTASARETLFFWAGRVVPSAHRLNVMYAHEPNVRELLMHHRYEPGFKIVNTFPAPAKPANHSAVGRRGIRRRLGAGKGPGKGDGGSVEVNAVEWMRRSRFCGVPPGQRYGDARRHLVAAFLGCVPVFIVPDGHHTLDEALTWRKMAIVVTIEELPNLPAILNAVAPHTLERMRRRLRCASPMLWYSSIYGECAPGMGSGAPDAFDALMRTLAERLAPRGRRSARWLSEPCS